MIHQERLVQSTALDRSRPIRESQAAKNSAPGIPPRLIRHPDELSENILHCVRIFQHKCNAARSSFLCIFPPENDRVNQLISPKRVMCNGKEEKRLFKSNVNISTNPVINAVNSMTGDSHRFVTLAVGRLIAESCIERRIVLSKQTLDVAQTLYLENIRPLQDQLHFESSEKRVR